MKMRLTPSLLACGWVLMLTSVQAVAQDAADASTAPAAVQPASPAPQNGTPAAKSPPTEGGTPTTAASLAADESQWMDNGLWDGADVGQPQGELRWKSHCNKAAVVDLNAV